jgi:hypothetical protein
MWIKGLVVGLVILLLCGVGLQDYRQSQVVGKESRFSLVLAGTDGTVSFVSFDPVEKRVFILPFPSELHIKSRSVGEYTISSLYKIGEYDESGGEFVRRKVQGFMRVPIPGYLVTSHGLRQGLWQGLWGGKERSNLSKLDVLTLLYRSGIYTWKEATEDELVRSGVLEEKDKGYIYRSDRLQQYVGTRLFDWGIGAEGVTMAVVNVSGIDGMGSDMADFLNNLGFDVVSVRTGNGVQEKSRVLAGDLKKYQETTEILQHLLGLRDPEQADIESYRAEIVIEVGTDGQALF